MDGTSIGNLTSGGDAYKLYVTPGQSYAVTETGTDVEGYTFLSAEISATDNLAVSNTDGMGFTFPADGMAAIPTVTVTTGTIRSARACPSPRPSSATRTRRSRPSPSP